MTKKKEKSVLGIDALTLMGLSIKNLKSNLKEKIIMKLSVEQKIEIMKSIMLGNSGYTLDDKFIMYDKVINKLENKKDPKCPFCEKEIQNYSV